MVIKTISLISQLLWECFYNASVKCYTSFWVEMDTFYHIKDVPPISTLSRVSVEFCQVSFSIDEDNHVVFFFLILSIKGIIFTDFLILNQLYFPGIKPTWSWCISFKVLSDSISSSLRKFSSIFTSDVTL